MKKIATTLFLIHSSFFLFSQSDFTNYVDPVIGTGGHGHTYPGATVPFGMVQLSPDTRVDGSWDGCSGYHYNDSIVYGFSHTHLNGTGCSDYGDIMLMPMTGEPSLDPGMYSAKFSHRDERASAGFYSVKLKDDILVELTSTARVGIHRYTFPASGNVSVVLDLTHRDKLLEGKIHPVSATVFEGLRRSEAWAKDQWVFYRIEFSKPVTYSYVQKRDDNDQKAWFKFNLDKNEKLLVKVSLSSVNEEGAKKNMEAEVPHWDFERVKREAHDAWQKELSKIEVSGGTEEQLKIFYTALYHTMVQPNIYNDVDGQYRGRDFKIHKAEGFNYYTVFSLWDTFRAWHPLMTIIDRRRTLDYIKTFLAQYEQGGLLPVWELSSNETECMIGYHAVSVIADAAVKGINGFNMEEAFEAMKKSAESRDRYGLGAYIDKGCLSAEDESSSVSKTLEYAYDDWCIAQMAQLLHHEKDYQYFMERSQSWKNLFDPETGFIRPRKNGGWLEPFDPYEVNNNYTEANAWQYTFFVPQEINSLIELSGGKEKFEKNLDELFTAESQTTGREQADITGMIGQYAHGNEPSHHMAYLYNYIGKPWKTQDRVRQILSNFYHASPDGLIGNEDCGQMSAWYVMSAIGLYQVCPGEKMFSLQTPLFQPVKLNLENGRELLLDVSEEGVFSGGEISYDEIMSGGKIMLTKNQNKPDQITNNGMITVTKIPSQHHRGEEFVSTPIIKSNGATFKNKKEIYIVSAGTSGVHYTLDGSLPTLQSSIFNPQYPIIIDSSCTINAIAVNKGGEASKVSTARFYKNPHPGWKINLVSTYSPQYTAGGDGAIIDGIRGDVDWQKGNWQGYQTDFECVIDLGKIQVISDLKIGFIQDIRSWILMPKQTQFSFSMDGRSFSEPLIVKNVVADNDYALQRKDFSVKITSQNARYVKVKAINYGKLPKWHLGAGGQAWIFTDEITIH